MILIPAQKYDNDKNEIEQKIFDKPKTFESKD